MSNSTLVYSLLLLAVFVFVSRIDPKQDQSALVGFSQLAQAVTDSKSGTDSN